MSMSSPGSGSVELIQKIEALEKSKEYSYEEKCIGTWVDGKPLYRKIISEQVNWQASQEIKNEYIPIGISNIKLITRTSFMLDKIGTSAYILPYIQSNAPSTYVTAIGNGNISIANKIDWADYTFVAIIEYTKTTD